MQDIYIIFLYFYICGINNNSNQIFKSFSTQLIKINIIITLFTIV